MTQNYIYPSTINPHDNVIKSSGDYTFSPVRVSYNIDIYEISLLLDDTNRFLGIESVNVIKNFYDPRKLSSSPGRSAEEILDVFFNGTDE